MGLRKPQNVFTEQGVAMVSSVLNSETAIEVNIQIIRTFTRIRQMLSEHTELRLEVYFTIFIIPSSSRAF